jgi:hypothetical protein
MPAFVFFIIKAFVVANIMYQQIQQENCFPMNWYRLETVNIAKSLFFGVSFSMKNVRFDSKQDKEFHTYSNEEYDRSGVTVERLRYQDVLDLMQLKLELRTKYQQEMMRNHL